MILMMIDIERYYFILNIRIAVFLKFVRLKDRNIISTCILSIFLLISVIFYKK